MVNWEPHESPWCRKQEVYLKEKNAALGSGQRGGGGWKPFTECSVGAKHCPFVAKPHCRVGGIIPILQMREKRPVMLMDLFKVSQPEMGAAKIRL